MAKKQTDKNRRLYFVIANVIIVALLLIAAFQLGFVGILLDKVFRYLFGEFHIVVFILLILICLLFIFKRKLLKQGFLKTLGYFLAFVAFLLASATFKNYGLQNSEVLAYFISNSKPIFNYEIHASGGFFGILLYSFMTSAFDIIGTYIALVVIIIIALLLISPTSIFKGFKVFKLKSKKPRKKKTKKTQSFKVEDKYVSEPKKVKSSNFITLSEETKKSSDHKVSQLELELEDVTPYQVKGKNYELPKLSLLDTAISSRISKRNSEAASSKGERLVEVLREFNIESELIDVHIGPSVTKFEIRPDSSVKVSRINSIADNIKMELAAQSIRIEAPIPGKSSVGIEIPNIENTPVKLFELLSEIPKSMMQDPLLFTLGKDLMGNTIYSNLEKMPHLLIAGATGAGKSVALNAIITTILLRTTPNQVRLLLIDPKKVEFTSFANAPHLITDIISEPLLANSALMRVVEIMDDRYRMFAEIGVKNIKAYREYQSKHPDEYNDLELIVVIIDELADLMVVAGKEVEASIQRITQLARAAGIHLIVATQRPSTDVITGIIKANIPSRISFAVSSGIDSRTILDTVGAERLLGNGDMLYYPVGFPAPVRLQGVFISDDEVARVANFAAKQPSPEHFDQFNFAVDNDDNPLLPKTKDELYDDVLAFVVKEQKASTSLIQRNFQIGYNRAARIVDALEEAGVIGPMAGSKPRDVYLNEIPDE